MLWWMWQATKKDLICSRKAIRISGGARTLSNQWWSARWHIKLFSNIMMLRLGVAESANLVVCRHFVMGLGRFRNPIFTAFAHVYETAYNEKNIQERSPVSSTTYWICYIMLYIKTLILVFMYSNILRNPLIIMFSCVSVIINIFLLHLRFQEKGIQCINKLSINYQIEELRQVRIGSTFSIH